MHVFVSIYLSIYLSLFISTYLSEFFPTFFLSFSVYSHLSIYLSIYPSIYLSLLISIYLSISIYILTPPREEDMAQGQILRGVLQVWIQSFPSPRLVVISRFKSSVCPTICPLLEGEYVDFMPSPNVFALREMQIASSKVWTRVTGSISNDVNHYTPWTSMYMDVCIIFRLTASLKKTKIMFNPPLGQLYVEPNIFVQGTKLDGVHSFWKLSIPWSWNKSNPVKAGLKLESRR